MKLFSQLKKNLKNDFSGLVPVKVALLGDTATQFLSIALRGRGFDEGFDLQIFEANFNQVEQQIFNPVSELYGYKPEIIILFLSSHQLLQKYNKLKPEEYNTLAERQMALINNLCNAINARLNAKVIFYNYPEIDDAVFGGFANKTPSSFIFQLRKLNYELMLYASETPNFYICDLSTIQNQAGRATLFQPSVYVNTEMVLGVDILPQVALRTLDIIGALHGQFKKCVVFDLDNTIWGGVIGDDDMEHIQLGNLGIGKAFTEFQHWLKKLKNRGIILAVCSKNTEAVAKAPFEDHPDMALHLDDIAVFIANWDNKVENIHQIKNTLNIGFDAMVYLDDSPFERNMVGAHIPGLTIPELPVDPADYLEYLYSLSLFETASFSNEDTDKTKHYQTAAKRNIEQQASIDEDAFLASLDMVSVVAPFNKFNTPRVAQLTQRSNQFNLRTIRYTDADIEKLAACPNYYTFTFNLADRFGDNGLIAIIILQKENNETLFIDTWLMSCRVLKRGMENFVLNTLAIFASENGFTTLKGKYIPTAKNGIVKDHYRSLGFIEKDSMWALDVASYQPKRCFITQQL